MKKNHFILLFLVAIAFTSTDLYAASVEGMIRNATSKLVRIGVPVGVLGIVLSGIAFAAQAKFAIDMFKFSVISIFIILGAGALGKFVEGMIV